MQPTVISNAPSMGPPTWLRQAIVVSVVLWVMSQVVPLPGGVRLLVVFGLAVGWGIAAARWAVQRFGRRAIIVIATIFLMAAGFIGHAFWLDAPNRRLVAEIEQLRGFHAASSNGLIVDKVDHVYINEKASDADVAQFTELHGLDDLHILFLDGPQIGDATANRLGRFKSLRFLTLSGTGVSAEVADELRNELPNCRVVVK